MKPEDALIHYSIGDIKTIKPISVGLIHATYKVSAASGVYILQRMHPMLSHPSLTEDYAAVTEHLASRNKESQRVVRPVVGGFVVPDDECADRAWRLLTYVPGVIHETIDRPATARACGAAVGEFQAALGDLKYKFQSTLAYHPYNTKKFFTRFQRAMKTYAHDPRMTAVKSDVAFLLKEIPKTMLPDDMPKRVVHGDLKITNFVFAADGKKVRAIIDIDTCARFPAIMELGDALRSWCGRAEDDPKNKFNMALYRAALAGYEAAAPGFLSARERRLIPRAIKNITLNLASRFLQDYFEECVFGWNEKRYKTRAEANLARARGQMALYRDLVKKFR